MNRPTRIYGIAPKRASRGVAACAVGALYLTSACAAAAVFKCVDASGKVIYQGRACDPSIRESTVKIEPAPPASEVRKPIVAPQTKVVAREPTAQEVAKAQLEAKGLRETWGRLGQALDRGEIEAALRELTPSAQQRFRPVFDTVLRKSKSFRFAQLGTVRSINLIGDRVATITITRDKPDGRFAYEAMLMKGPDGKWLIDGM